MSMSADLRDRLKAAAMSAAGRIYRDERPQGSGLPAVRMQVVSEDRPSTMEGRQSFRSTRVQLDCMGADRTAADDLAEQAITAAEPSGEVGGTQFQRAFVDSVRTYSDRADSGVTTFVTSIDLIVWHSPAA